MQAAHDDLGINDVDDAHGGVAQGDGNADEQDLLNDLPAGGGNVRRFLPVPVGDEIGAQEQHGYRCARRDAYDSSCRAELSGLTDVEHIPGQRQTDAQLQKGLQHLADGGGGHVALTLGVATHTGQQAHAEHRRGQRLYSSGGQRVVQESGQRVRAEEHQHGAHQTQTEEQPDGGGEDPPLLIFQSFGVGLAGHPGDGQGQTCRGKGQQKVVDLVGGVKISLSRAAQNIAKRDLIGCADELDDDHSRRQNGGAA